MVPLQIPEKAEDKSGADRGGSSLSCGMCLSMGAHAAHTSALKVETTHWSCLLLPWLSQ